MKITTTWFNDQFNVELASAEGKEAFLVVKGCRIASGSKGEFVSWPARKQDNGKWWNYVYASEAFNAAVLGEANKSRPRPDTRTLSERKSRDDDPPF